MPRPSAVIRKTEAWILDLSWVWFGWAASEIENDLELGFQLREAECRGAEGCLWSGDFLVLLKTRERGGSRGVEGSLTGKGVAHLKRSGTVPPVHQTAQNTTLTVSRES